jgi:hypothetical protein
MMLAAAEKTDAAAGEMANPNDPPTLYRLHAGKGGKEGRIEGAAKFLPPQSRGWCHFSAEK